MNTLKTIALEQRTVRFKNPSLQDFSPPIISTVFILIFQQMYGQSPCCGQSQYQEERPLGHSCWFLG